MSDVKRIPDIFTQTIRAKRHGSVMLSDTVRLAKGRIHEATGEGVFGFALSVAARLKGPIIWIVPKYGAASLCPAGLTSFLDPGRIVKVTVLNVREALWSAEQALCLAGAPCVILEIHDGPDLRESRRLQIAAEETGALGLVLIKGSARTSAAQTRWKCTSAQDPSCQAFWELTKSKDGQHGRWRVTYPNRMRGDHAPGLIPVVPAPAA